MFWQGAAALLLAASTQISQAAAQVITITQYPSTCSAIYTSGSRSVTIVQSTVTVSPIPWDDNSPNTGTTFVLQALPDSGESANGAPRWVLPNGQLTTAGSLAAQYTIRNGQLTTVNGDIYTFEGIPYGTFGVSATNGNIRTTFRIVDGKLVWSNGNFTDGAAKFYQTPDGAQDPARIIASFYGDVNGAWVPYSLYARPVNAATEGTTMLPGMSTATMMSSIGDRMSSMQPTLSNSPYSTPSYTYQRTTGQSVQPTNRGPSGQPMTGGNGVPTSDGQSTIVPTSGGQGVQSSATSSGGFSSGINGGFDPTSTAGQSSSAAPVPTRPISPDGICGGGTGFYCADGFCCGQYGYCGQEIAYCGPGCQVGFGSCWSAVSSTAGVVTSGTPTNSVSVTPGASTAVTSGPGVPVSPSAGTATSTGSATTSPTIHDGPVPTVATCPEDDGAIVTDEFGNQYTLGCGQDTTFGAYASRTVIGGFNECIRLCGADPNCQAFTYSGYQESVNGVGSGICYFKRLDGNPPELVEVDNGENLVGGVKEVAATPSGGVTSAVGSWTADVLSSTTNTFATFTGPETLIGPDPTGPQTRTTGLSSAIQITPTSMSMPVSISLSLSTSGSVTVTVSMSMTMSSMMDMTPSASGEPEPALPPSPNGGCGIQGNGGSPEGYTCTGSLFGDCCSFSGFCGYSADYCLAGCQEEYGECTPDDGNPITGSGSCGVNFGNQTCTGGIFGPCCSNDGFCGYDDDYCVPQNCDPDFGECDRVDDGGEEVPDEEEQSTSTMMMSSTSTMSQAATSTSTLCPAANGTIYTNPSGQNYTILCGMGFDPDRCTPAPALGLLACIDLCLGSESSCVGVTFELGRCCLKSRFEGSNMTPGMDSAVIVDVNVGPYPVGSSSSSIMMMSSSSSSAPSSGVLSTPSSSPARITTTTTTLIPTATTTSTTQTTTTTTSSSQRITTTTTSTTRTTTTTSSSSSSAASPYLVLPSPTPCSFGDPQGYDQDDSYCEVVLPFPMRVYGQSSTSTFASTNGLLSIIQGSALFASLKFPNPNSAPNTLAPFHDDQYAYAGVSPRQGIFYQITGTVVTYEWYLGRGGIAESIYHYTVRYDSAVPGVFTYTYYSTGGTGDQGLSAAVGSQGENAAGALIGNTYAYHVQSIAPGLIVVCDTDQNTCRTGP